MSLPTLLQNRLISLLGLVALGLAVGAVIFFTFQPGKPKVGVITIPFAIIDDFSMPDLRRLLDRVTTDDSIKAVVIKLNSPGGSAADSEELYIKTARLREKKPVVFVVDSFAASGGYMMAMGSNYIYAKPTSFIGSVGVILTLGPDQPPNEQLITTGPFKSTGGTRRTFVRMMEIAKESFLQTVVNERGARLRISPEEISEARLYLGTEAVKLGLVDAIGEDIDAVRKAASLAGLDRYGQVNITEELEAKLGRSLRFSPSLEEAQLLAAETNLPFQLGLPKLYYLYATTAP